MLPAELAALDAWIEQQPDKPTRPEAVRQLLARLLPTGEPGEASPAYLRARRAAMGMGGSGE
jgi:hypothetical protein